MGGVKCKLGIVSGVGFGEVGLIRRRFREEVELVWVGFRRWG